MSGDYTRFTFDPRRHRSGVFMQQGRVQLDADWNEHIELLDRRWRAETIDIIGRAVVPTETPDGFDIVPSAGTFTIGRGRIYVDGLLAENHGDVPVGGLPQFDPVLAEVRGTLPVPYTGQPYYPNPPALPTGGPHVAYLDVWQREVTATEDPTLVEKAVGVDTATRWQTVWQVRVLPNVGGAVTCSTPVDSIPGWTAATAPSAGRLTTSASATPADDDPCVVPPNAGYRGVENRLYRVEIHDAGRAGGAGATFKWSRDHASVTTRVTNINGARDEITVSRTGRDAVLRFNSGDWIEITDDWRELGSQPGLMRKIVQVDDVRRTIRLDAALPAGAFPTSGAGNETDAARNTRIRKWDQKGLVRDTAGAVVADVDANGGVIPVPAAGTTVVLENGVQITFSLATAGGAFRVADFWSFAARTSDASVEILDEAPPRGIHHHYAKLAIVTFPASRVDCRVFWPPRFGESCCTRVVFPGEDIQAAIDALPASGGCVCLKTGVHNTRGPLRITRSNVTVHGETRGAIVRRADSYTVFMIGDPAGTGAGPANVTLASLQIEGRMLDPGPPGEESIVQIVGARDAHVCDCDIRVFGSGPIVFTNVGIGFGRAERLTVTGCSIRNTLLAIGLADGRGHVIASNRLVAATYRIDLASTSLVIPLGFYGIYAAADVGACLLRGNHVENFHTGIHTGSGTIGTLIAENTFVRPDPGPVAATDVAYAIYAVGRETTIVDNAIDLMSPAYGGIRVIGARSRVAGNRLQAMINTGYCIGIAAMQATPTSASQPDDALIADNVLIGRTLGIVVASADRVRVLNNLVMSDGDRRPWAGVSAIEANDTTVEGNAVIGGSGAFLGMNGVGNRVVGNHARDGSYGVLALLQMNFEASSNTFENLAETGIAFAQMLGLTRIANNRVLHCGYGNVGGQGNGILGLVVLGEANVEDNEVLNTGISQDGAAFTTDPAIGISLIFAMSCKVSGNVVGYSVNPGSLNITREHRALLALGAYARIGHALVVNNKFMGPGATHLVEFVRLSGAQRFEKVTFSNNICDHLPDPTPGTTGFQVATVSLWASHLAVLGNQVKSTPPKQPSIRFNNISETAVLGNVCTGPFHLLPASVQAQFGPLNVFV